MYQGFTGVLLTAKEYFEKGSAGCGGCCEDIRHFDPSEVLWVNDNTFVCLDCKNTFY